MRAHLRRCGCLFLCLALLLCALPVVRAADEDQALAWARQRGILTGSISDSFDLQRCCSRAEVLTWLWRFAGSPAGSPESGFSDVIPSACYAKAVNWAAENELIRGCTVGRFRPNLLCTRAQLATMLWRYAGSPAPAGSQSYSDLPESATCRDALFWAVEQKLMEPVGRKTIFPYAACTGAQVLTALFRCDQMNPRAGAKKLIVIDPGHQLHANSDTEPLGPGATEQKAKVSGGTYGQASQLSEYELALTVSMQLRDELVRRGYEVRLTRETHDVDLSNKQRAEFANSLGADVMIRIHANGANDPSVRGALTINMTRSSPYNAWLYPKSRALSEALLDGLCASTGAIRRMIWDTDTMVGINWSQVPVSIVEMGYMSNPEEDLLMATAKYQHQIVMGLANGLDAYFKNEDSFT